MLINVTGVIAFTFYPHSDWRTCLYLNLFDNALLIAFAVIRKDKLMWHLLLFGLLVGILELPTDAWIVDYTRTLDYAYGGGPMIWRSPAYMPIAWEIVAIQFGYIGLLLVERFGWRGALITAFMGGLNIPFYEEMALKIHWWRYHDCPMLLHTPWAIIVGEFFIAMAFASVAPMLRSLRITKTITAAILGSIGLFVGYAVPYALIQSLASR